MNQGKITNPQPETPNDDAASTAWAKEVADYLSGADNDLARELEDRPVSRVAKSNDE